MAETSCGILGIVAFLTTLVRGWIHGRDAESILVAAWLALMLFSIIGIFIGSTAEKIVEDAVKGRLAAELTAKRGLGNKHKAE